MEHKDECYITVTDVTGQTLVEEEGVWVYVGRYIIILSRDIVILRSCLDSLLYLDDDICDNFSGVHECDNTLNNNFSAIRENGNTLSDTDDLLPVFPTIENEQSIDNGRKRKICTSCNCTYIIESEGWSLLPVCRRTKIKIGLMNLQFIQELPLKNK